MWTTSIGALVPYSAAPIRIQTEYGALSHFPINVISAGSRLPRQAAASDPKQEDGEGIRGSDVLWALHRAAAKKKKKAKTKKKGVASTEATATRRDREKDSVDYSNVKPLVIKSEWSLKLDELEKRLQELEEQEDTI